MYETGRIILVQSSIICISELLFRLIVQLPQEIFCYNVDPKRALKSVLSIQTIFVCFGIVSLLLGIIFGEYSLPVCIPVLVAYFICRFVGISQSPMMEQLHFVRSDVGLDYGSGLACSYFYGYLKIVLPSTGEVSSKNIKERLEDFEDAQQVTVPIKKLFIMVPDSMFTPDTFNSDSLITSRQLEAVLHNRAGNAKRPYNNTMYKINHTNWYIAIEGATPLQTVYESMVADDRLKHLRKEILASFVTALRKLLWDDLKCRNLCEVVQVNDDSATGEEFDYGRFMKNLISRQLKQNVE